MDCQNELICRPKGSIDTLAMSKICICEHTVSLWKCCQRLLNINTCIGWESLHQELNVWLSWVAQHICPCFCTLLCAITRRTSEATTISTSSQQQRYSYSMKNIDGAVQSVTMTVLKTIKQIRCKWLSQKGNCPYAFYEQFLRLCILSE